LVPKQIPLLHRAESCRERDRDWVRVRPRRVIRPPRGVGRARGDALARYGAGREDRPVSLDFFAQQWLSRAAWHSRGLRGAVLGRCGDSAVAAAPAPLEAVAVSTKRHERAEGRVAAAMFGDADDVKLGALRVRARRRQRCRRDPDSGGIPRGQRRVGPERGQSWVTNGGIAKCTSSWPRSSPRWAAGPGPHVIVPRERRGLSQGRSVRTTRG